MDKYHHHSRPIFFKIFACGPIYGGGGGPKPYVINILYLPSMYCFAVNSHKVHTF